MGVTGLWRLVEPAGKPVPVETLENKILAVDISIWLHQMVKGYQDAKGAPLPNAHLMGLFQRLCKLLYFRIKPVFVFDGGFPDLKKETIAKRQDHKAKCNTESERIKRELALLLSKKTAVSSLLGKKISPSKQQSSTSNNDDLFKLPALPQVEGDSGTESDDERNLSNSSIDLHTVDIDSDNFKRLPIKEKYDILLDLKETRKQNSWGKLEELPKQSDNFSNFQMQRLLKRRKVQECLQETEKEIGDSGMSLNDLECLLNEEGINTKMNTLPTRRIASNVTSRFLLIKDVKKALLDAKKKQEQEENKPGTSNVAINKINEIELKSAKVDELEEDLQKAIKMSLECMDETSTSNLTKADDSWTSCMTDTDSEYLDSDSEGDRCEQPDMSCAKAYIMQYSDFTHKFVDEIVTVKKNSKSKQKLPKINKIIEEINKEKSVIIDKLDLSSSGDEFIQGATKLESKKKGSEKFLSSLNATPTSVISIGFTSPETISINTNLKDVNESSEIFEETIEMKQLILSSHDSDNFKSNKESDSHMKFVSRSDTTQASVICVGDITTETVHLDTSLENLNKSKANLEKVMEEEQPILSSQDCDDFKSYKSNKEEDSSDNEFEEVPESNGAIELILNMGEVPGDDIFADIFTDKKNNPKVIGAMPLENTKAVSESAKLVNSIVIQNTLNTSKLENVNVTDGLHGNKKAANTETQKTTTKTDNSGRIEFNNDSSDNLAQINKQINNNILFNVSKETDQQEIGTISNQNQYVDSLEPIKSSSKGIINQEELNKMVEEIQNHEQDLLQEKGRLDRVGRNITEQMTKEAQELLQIFGIPYIVAPMEAEAQCAFLERAKLTDGTITDDSDIWLFGGRTVYKNFFNQKKHVLQFQAERIEKSFNLSREQLILLALLVGSDYTMGITGVGPVTAMEILASFPFNKKEEFEDTVKHTRYAEIVKGLQEFKLWIKAGKRTDNISLKKKLKNVSLTEDFPSVRVVQAYLEPNVEKSEDKFTWGELDVTILRDYTKAKFGWSQNKLDEIIKPVLKRLTDSKTQKSIQDFFKRKIEFQSLDHQMSKRVKAAVQKLGPDEQITDNLEAEIGKNYDKNNKISTNRKAKAIVKNKISQTVPKKKRNDETSVLLQQGVKVVSLDKDVGKSDYEVKINKTDHCQEIIPQREKNKQNLLENKLRAIEVFRKTQIDKRRKTFRRKALKPKENAELSESD